MTQSMRLRHMLRERDVRNHDDEQVLSVYRDLGVVPKQSRTDNFNKTPEDLSNYKLVLEGDVVVNKMKAWQGSVAVSPHQGIVSGDYLVCEVVGDVDRRYLHYLFRSSPLVHEFARRATGIRPSQWRIYWDDLADIAVRLPDPIDQRRIADFLERETVRINSLIAFKRRLIGALGFRRSVMIEQAIGFDRWPQWRLRHALVAIEQGWSPQCDNRPAEAGEWGVLKAGCVNGSRFRHDENKALPDDLAPQPRYLVQRGDVLMSRANTLELVGSAAIVDAPTERLLLCDKLFRLRPQPGLLDPSFLVLAVSSPRIRSAIELEASGASDSMQNIGQDTVLGLRIPLPPIEEQRRIVNDLTIRLEKVETIRALLERQIPLLREHRQALITAAVTGQLGIPAAA